MQYFFLSTNEQCMPIHGTPYLLFEMSHFPRHKNQEYVVIYKSDIQLLSIKVSKPFPSCLKPLFQSEAKCEAVHIEIYFHYYVNKTHFQVLHLALF